MTGLSPQTRTELAHRSGGGIVVTLVWVQGDGEDTAVVCVCDKREGAYFEIPTEESAGRIAGAAGSGVLR